MGLLLTGRGNFGPSSCNGSPPRADSRAVCSAAMDLVEEMEMPGVH